MAGAHAGFMISMRPNMTRIRPNAQYNVAAADSLPVRVAAHQRRKMFARFLADTGVAAGETVLDVGVTSDRSYRTTWRPGIRTSTW
jgi:hypothetical protein